MENYNHAQDDAEALTEGKYKSFLLEQIANWQEVLVLAQKSGSSEICDNAKRQISKIKEKMMF